MKRSLLLVGFSVLLGCAAPAKELSVSLEWDRNSEPNIVGYRVYRSKAASEWDRLNSVLIPHPTAGKPTYTDTIDDSQTYYYVVTAVDDEGRESDLSNKVSTATVR